MTCSRAGGQTRYKTRPGSFIPIAVLESCAYTRKLRCRGLRKTLREASGRSHLGVFGSNAVAITKIMKMSPPEISNILKEGELEKRSDNLLQFWKRKTCVLTTDSLNIYADNQKKTKSKELKLQSIKKVDCVERTGKFVYFTIVTTDNKEIDFRCSSEDHCWNAVITMALIDFQNRKAIQDFKTRQDTEDTTLGQQDMRMARAP
ncbi:pleckstrin homology-like domain family A member 2 [Electrophorus electricus]|nr:pleckstrin homology-like domain family A member 2 [Electrophorus electricus]